MKTIAKISGIILIAFAFGLAPTACKKENQNSSMTIRMTDAPANYSQVNVDIIGLDLNYESEGWTTVSINRGIYNLLELQNNVSVILADNVKIRTGKITQMRMILGKNNSVIDTAGIQTFIKVPSGSESGLKINIDQVITANRNIIILLDFDAKESIVEQGNGKISLKPVIKLKSVIQN